MQVYEVSKPIGLSSFCEEIENVCKKSPCYNHGARPNHLIVPLDSGQGRTTLLEYMVDMYKKHDILEFTCSRDDFLEVFVDGFKPETVEQSFAIIENAHCYANEYSNIIGIDISDIANYPGQSQYACFLKRIQHVCKHACVVFFIHSKPSKNEEILLTKLATKINHLKRLSVEPYSYSNICDLIMKNLTENGARFDHEAHFREVLSNAIEMLNISSIKTALIATAELIHFASLSSKGLFLNEECVQILVNYWTSSNERSECK